ncbi:MAG: inositol monophosphatase [Acidobacteriota bacterium]|nr:inositol monophosphatase [Acidobacteriota bacterium]MDE3043491.1 inositol monophosphatase [Acidobacteriota bacterium]MDE3106810.1 inositol monophosphatase [Acidobacteriota bacterium]MDE3223495.1 inositol monophosphatase [Acidobacteriota bacterium]
MNRALMDVLHTCALEIDEVVRAGTHGGFSGQRETQYHLDLAADEVALRVLLGAGYRVVSEESGVTGEGSLTVVVDPIDGSTNCDHGVPFYATSLGVLRDGELIAGLVRNQATGTIYEAEAGAGATRDGTPISVSGLTDFTKAVVAFSGLPSRHLGWSQYRALGAASLEICLVADGSLDAYSVARRSTLNPWDYLGGLLILREAGGVASDLEDRELVTSAPETRRPVFAATDALASFLREAGTL